MRMEIKLIDKNKENFMDLLLLADEQENMVKKYLEKGELFALYDNDLKTVAVVTLEKEGIFELKNIATYENYQKNGYGSIMINHIIENYKNRSKSLFVGTGDVDWILNFYKKFGFVYSHSIKDFFIDNYDHEMFENGKQLKDMIYLKIDFNQKIEYREKTQNDNNAVLEIINGWGSDILVSRGKAHKAENLDGVLAYDNDKIIGLGLYYIKNNCEIVLLETFIQNKGIGSKIIEKIIEIAKNRKCKRIWLVTTNSNINAIKFYQKRGFHISNIYINAMEEARKIKPEIPKIADNGIEIRDEIEFEYKI